MHENYYVRASELLLSSARTWPTAARSLSQPRMRHCCNGDLNYIVEDLGPHTPHAIDALAAIITNRRRPEITAGGRRHMDGRASSITRMTTARGERSHLAGDSQACLARMGFSWRPTPQSSATAINVRSSTVFWRQTQHWARWLFVCRFRQCMCISCGTGWHGD